ncbi:MAG: UDP-2,4-diacetamido-2,4,6-trideoxy-beta-L-altropyranose hydrolase [Syntrophorhabdus sp.]|nr:UDP-2,4-diacetamido-2,4,6-trideoxy-beta-L-altropyranose hydrolase [Syntrophorhabdus sp.]
MKRFLLRMDASVQVGLGHLKRCVTLSEELKKRGHEVYFICRADTRSFLSRLMATIENEAEYMEWSLDPIEDAKHVTKCCARKRIDIAIVDHYRANEEYQKVLYEAGVRWLQFDGRASHPFWADWVLNMSPAANRSLYDGLIRKEARLLLGPGYAVLRREFAEKSGPKAIKGNVRRILLTFGGGDDAGAAMLCLNAIKSIDASKTVVMNSGTSQERSVRKWCDDPGNRTTAVFDTSDVSVYMAAADLGITAGGTTVFEMAALGVPLLMLQIADNQVPVCKAWQERGYGVNLGVIAHLKPEDVLRETSSLMEDEARRKDMSEKGASLVDGRGAGRVTEALLS